MCHRRQKSCSETAVYGGGKVLRELEAEEERDADRDARVTAEVREDLDGVAVDREQSLERRMAIRRREDLVDDVRRQVVRDHDLEKEPGEDQVIGARRVHAARVARPLELRQQLARADDRARDEVREEGEEDGEPREVAGSSSPRYVSTTYEIAMNV
jgi:hypothetical protein